MIRIRLARSGSRQNPFYHIVVTNRLSSRDGRYIERLGFLNPVAVGGETPLRIDQERVQYWVKQGAKMSERVKNLVKFYNRHGEGESQAHQAPPESQAKEANPQAPATSE